MSVFALVVLSSVFIINGKFYVNFLKDHSNEDLDIHSECSLACLFTIAAHVKSCLLEHIKNSGSSKWLLHAVQTCSDIFVKRLKFVPLKNSDETKYVLLPMTQDVRQCTVVTLGIGNDIGSEMMLKEQIPSCKFYGADPIYDSGKIYEKIGSFYNMAVGSKDGTMPASVFEKGYYITKSVPYLSFEKFLKLTNVSHIDYLFIDAEGAEYGIMHFLETAFLKQINTAICQFNVELHMPLGSYGTTEVGFNAIFMQFITKSEFIPVLSEMVTHYRTTWINVYNKKCVQKYLPYFCNETVL